jgi:hypothetical protein
MRVDDHERVEQTGGDEKRIAVLVGHREDAPGAEPQRPGDEVRQARPEVGDGRQRHERLTGSEREEPALERQPDHEHERQRREEHHAFRGPPQPQVAPAGNQPAEEVHERERLGRR